MTEALEATRSALPALASTPALEISAEDVALPKIKIGQFMSDAVQEGTVPAGAIYSSLGQDDPDPQVLWKPAKSNEKPGVVFYVLALRKGKSISDGGELVTFDFHDPSAPPEAWTTYTYTVAIPSVDADVPFRWLFTRTGAPAAKQLNMVLARNAAKGPAYINAFECKSAPRENAKGKFFVPRVTVVEADEDAIKVAEKLAVMISGQSAEIHAAGEEPAI